MSGPDDPSHLITALGDDLDHGFTALYDAYRTPVFTTALRATGSWTDAEDFTAETFLRAYRSLISDNPPPLDTLRPRAWLLTILLNTVRNDRRTKARKPPPTDIDNTPERPDTTQDPARAAELHETNRDLATRLATLTAKQRDAVILRHVLDLPIEEIAVILDCAEGTAKSHISRGLTALRKQATTGDTPPATATPDPAPTPRTPPQPKPAVTDTYTHPTAAFTTAVTSTPTTSTTSTHTISSPASEVRHA
ncbi:RNA polymerase sigma factor [Phytomonospora endophytica]|uniref:RNA polymerase sigma-70 factor (ECF subfamily) n=1 Tax=Phytomonospora endophytica TaxID=714109 RepID=A0A841FIU0_9ACTN|nr:RNA polymerase sigma factor [Phytomonospora endophytica]MBB6033748.1 RNA polymerase sigma-70 factor (ECF subfamily) [Phytomonospora endophytica]